MSNVQLYYMCSDRLKQTLRASGIQWDNIVPYGDKSPAQLYTDIGNDPYFCRGEESIDYTYFKGLVRNDITLYALVDGQVAGALNFMFNVKQGERIINFNGLCSPIKYAGAGVGQSLVRCLIRIAKQTSTAYIHLDCKGDVMYYYRDKFGFEITSTKTSYDDDDDDDDDASPTTYYFMRLDVSKVTGGRRRKRTAKRRQRANRRKNTRKRYLRK